MNCTHDDAAIAREQLYRLKAHARREIWDAIGLISDGLSASRRGHFEVLPDHADRAVHRLIRLVNHIAEVGREQQ